MRRKFWVAMVTVLIMGGLTVPGSARAEKIQGQKQMMIVDDTFRFVPGTWGDYTIVDKVKKESYHFVLSILNDKQVHGKNCSWMEIRTDMKGKPSVITKVLVEKTRQGPGEPLKAIVQIAGFDPFIVPEKYLKGKDAQVAPEEKFRVVKHIRQQEVSFKGRTIHLWKVRAASENGKKIMAWVSEEIPPLGVYKVDIPAYGMYLNDWGTGAKSEIKGSPMNFYLWIAKIIGAALADGMKETKK